MDLPRVSIIILNWNGLQDTLECLESVFKLDYPRYDVVVVDNGSTDESGEVLETSYPNVTLIRNGQNLGFAGGNNAGIRHALNRGADYIWLLNNDTVVEPDALLNLVMEAVKDPGIGIAGSKIYYYGSSRRIWFVGARIDWARGISDHIGLGEADLGQYDYIREVDRVTGCSMLVKKSVCDRVGLLDETFFLYVEEVDWCVRARNAGFKCVLVQSSVIYHKASVSVLRIGSWHRIFNYYNTRNFLYLIKKSFSFPVREIILLTVISRRLRHERANCLRMVLSWISPSHSLEPGEAPVAYAVRDFLWKRMGKADYRFELQPKRQ